MKRREVSAGEYDAAGIAAKQLLVTNPLFLTSQHIACYFGQDDEFDCAPIIQEVWNFGKTCYLPVISAQHENNLEFVVYHSKSPLRLNRYNIFEPENGARLAAEKLDLVIVPLIAFDARGYRVGTGGGYYDRTFAFKEDKNIKKPFLLGLAYQFQAVEAIPNSPWDVALDGVLIEKKLIII